MAAISFASMVNGQPNHSGQQFKTPQTNGVQNYSKPPLPIIVIGPVGLEREKTVEPNWENPNCERPGHHDEADLCQQMSMAVAAQKAVTLNYIQIAIGVITLFGLWLTVRYTRITAKAASDATDIARRALHDLERPFIFVKELNLLTDENRFTQILHQARLSVVLENSGSTPAVRMAYSVNCGQLSNPDSDSFPDLSPENISRGVLGPKAIITTASKRISAGSVAQILSGQDRWFIWGAVEYDDVFTGTTRHRMEYCFEIRVRELANKSLFFWFPMHNRFNAADGDCLRQPQPYKVGS